MAVNNGEAVKPHILGHALANAAKDSLPFSLWQLLRQRGELFQFGVGAGELESQLGCSHAHGCERLEFGLQVGYLFPLRDTNESERHCDEKYGREWNRCAHQDWPHGLALLRED